MNPNFKNLTVLDTPLEQRIGGTNLAPPMTVPDTTCIHLLEALFYQALEPATEKLEAAE